MTRPINGFRWWVNVTPKGSIPCLVTNLNKSIMVILEVYINGFKWWVNTTNYLLSETPTFDTYTDIRKLTENEQKQVCTQVHNYKYKSKEL